MRIEEEIFTTHFQSDIQKAHVNVLFTSGWICNRITASLKPFNITHQQYNLLRILRGQGQQPMRAKDILSRMIDRSSNITRLIDRLEVKKLVSRSPAPKNAKEKEVSLTSEGYQLLGAIDVYWQDHSPHTGLLSKNEASQLNTLLDKLRELKAE